MNGVGRHPDPRLLQRFNSLGELAEGQLELLSQALQIHTAPKGKRVIQHGATEAYSFLLLAGEVELKATDGGRKLIKAGTESAFNPIAQLLPRRYDVTAITPIAYLEVDSHLLEELRESSRQNQAGHSMVVEQEEDFGIGTSAFPDSAQTVLAERMRRDLEHDQLLLPSLPEIALRIGRALNDEVTDAQRIAQMIQTDPAITTKIIRAANSALYVGRQQVDSCAGAVVRLGVNATHKLVLSFALREVFRAQSPVLRQQMLELWSHSTKVGAICYVLARLTRRFNPEHAMLAGLVHDIGSVAVLTYADHFPELGREAAQIEDAVARMRGEIGAMILKKWDFPEDVVVSAREAEDWQRDPDPEPDYCDLVIIAQLHSYVGTPRMAQLPHLGELPCFEKMELGELTPRLSLKILDKAQDQLRHAEGLLGI